MYQHLLRKEVSTSLKSHLFLLLFRIQQIYVPEFDLVSALTIDSKAQTGSLHENVLTKNMQIGE